MSTNVYDWTTVTSPSEALDWFNNSIRKGAEYNVFGNKTVFEAIVLADAYPLSINAAGIPGFNSPVGNVAQDIATWGVNTLFAFKARLVGNPSPHAFLPDPCNPAYAEFQALLNISIIDSHTTFVSQVGYSTEAGKRPKTGDIVEVRLRPGPNGFDLQYGDFIKVLDSYRAGAEENTRPECMSMAALFKNSPSVAAASTARSHYTAPLDAFYTRLRASDSFSTFKDNFLKGLAANAQHESGLRSDANGDRRPRVADTPAIEVGDHDSCSFGYWQLNVCSTTGAGRAFAQFFGVGYGSMVEKARLLVLINSEANQFRFMGQHMRTMFPTSQTGQSGTKTASQWAQEIGIQFERCAWCKRAPAAGLKTVGSTTHREDHETIARGLTADDLEASLTAIAAI